MNYHLQRKDQTQTGAKDSLLIIKNKLSYQMRQSDDELFQATLNFGNHKTIEVNGRDTVQDYKRDILAALIKNKLFLY